MQQLHGLDSVMVLGEIHNVPLHIGALFVYRPAASLTFEQFRNLMQEQVSSHLPLLQCRLQQLPLSIDKPYWVKDPDFNLDYHLQRFALPRPADWAQLHHLVAQFHAEPLNRQRPLWQAMLIEGLDHLNGLPKGCVGLVLKIHHAMADGKTAIRIFSSLHSLSPDPSAPLMVEGMPAQHTDFSPPGLFSKYSRAYWQAISSPVRLARNISAITPALWRSVAKGSQGKKGHVPEKAIFNRMPDADRVIGHIRLPMKSLHAIESATGTTINDIALCVVAGALRDYLRQHHALPAGDLIAGMPINIRTEGDNTLLGNRMGFANLSLYTSIEDPAERLGAIHAATTVVKRSDNRASAGSLLSLLDNLNTGMLVWAGKRLVATGLLDSIRPLNNTLVTNVPGIQQPCYLCGAELVDYLGFGLLAPTLTLFHVVSSIHSHANISFVSCSNSLTDADGYSLALEKSWQQLQAAVNR